LATVVVALLVGLVGGTVGALIWGAHRVATSYDRLVEEVDAPDLMFFCDERCEGPGSMTARLQAEPAIGEVAAIRQQFVSIRTTSGAYLGLDPSIECSTGAGELDLIWSEWPRTGRPAARVVGGRLPDPASANEVALSSITASRAHVAVGDTLFLTTDCATGPYGVLDPPVPLKVVGVLVGFFDVRPPGQVEYFENVYVSKALIERTGFESQDILAAWLRPGKGVADVSREVRDASRFDLDDHASKIREDLGSDAAALRLFAVALLLSAVAVLGQLLSGSIRSAVSVNRRLLAIGGRRRELSSLGLIHGGLIGLGAAVVAGVTIVVLAPMVPLGVAGPVDQGSDVGVVVGTVLVAGAATLSVVLVLSIIPALLASRPGSRSGPSRAGFLPARVVEALHGRASTSLGVRFALEPESAPHRAPIRSGLVTSAVALAAVTGVITFVSGLEHLRTTPRLVGWNWDFIVGGDGQDVGDMARAISARSDVERSGSGILYSFGISLTDDLSGNETIFGFDSGAGGVRPTVLDGRAPEGADEMLVAPGLAARQGLSIGDVTTLYALTPLARLAEALGVPGQALADQEVTARPVEIVGIGVIPMFDGRLDYGSALTLDGFVRMLPQPDRAAVMRVFEIAPPGAVLKLLLDERGPIQLLPSERRELSDAGPDGTPGVLASWSDEQFARLIPDDPARPQVVFVDVAPGQDPLTVYQRLVDEGLVEQQAVDAAVSEPDGLSPERIVKLDLSDVGWIPTSFAYLMSATALVTLGYVVVSTAHSRRRTLATLRAIGFTAGQTRRTIAWQSVTTVAVSIVMALPFGVVGGRIAWQRYATGLHVVPEPVVPWSSLAAFVATALIMAAIGSVIPGWLAVRQRPVDSLRSDE
jgi:hypothetical protein